MAMTAFNLSSLTGKLTSPLSLGGSLKGLLAGESSSEDFSLTDDMPSVAWVKYEATLGGAYPVLDAEFYVVSQNSPIFSSERCVEFDRIRYAPLSYRITPASHSQAWTVRYTGIPVAIVKPITEYAEDLVSLCQLAEVQLNGDAEVIVPMADEGGRMLFGQILNRYRMQSLIKSQQDAREPVFFWYDPKVNKENGGTVNVATPSQMIAAEQDLTLDPNIGMNVQVSLVDSSLKNLFDLPEPPFQVTANAYVNALFGRAVEVASAAPLLTDGSVDITVGSTVSGWEKFQYYPLDSWFSSAPICVRFIYDNSEASRLTPFHYTFAEYLGTTEGLGGDLAGGLFSSASGLLSSGMGG